MYLEQLTKKYRLNDAQVKRLKFCLDIHKESKKIVMEANFKLLYCNYTLNYFAEQVKKGYCAEEIFTKIKRDCVNHLINKKFKKNGRIN